MHCQVPGGLALTAQTDAVRLRCHKTHYDVISCSLLVATVLLTCHVLTVLVDYYIIHNSSVSVLYTQHVSLRRWTWLHINADDVQRPCTLAFSRSPGPASHHCAAAEHVGAVSLLPIVYCTRIIPTNNLQNGMTLVQVFDLTRLN